MLAPTARQLNLLAEEVRAIAAQMRNPETKRMMAGLALTYDRLAEFAALREASDRRTAQP
jgi:hypothetical protein